MLRFHLLSKLFFPPLPTTGRSCKPRLLPSSPESDMPRVNYHFEAAARLIILPALHPQALCCIMATASCVGHRQKHGYLKPPSLGQACTTTSQCVDHRLRFRLTELHTQTAATTTRSKWQDPCEEVPSSRMHILHILHLNYYSIYVT